MENNINNFILFVIPDIDDISYMTEITNEYNIKIINSLNNIDDFIYDDELYLVIIDISLIHNEDDVKIVRWIYSSKLLPIMILVDSNDEAISAIDMEVADFVYKPIIPKILLYQITRVIKNIYESKVNSKINLNINDKFLKTSKELYELHSNVIGVLSEIIEFRDFTNNAHDIRTRGYVEIMIRKMIEIPNVYRKEISMWNIEEHIVSSQLHDIGKIGISTEILTKKGILSESEYKKIKRHVIIGVNIIDRIQKKIGHNPYLPIARKYIIGHHEYWNGKGYPYKKRGNNITLEGRIMAIVDSYDAITSIRSYKSEISHENAIILINDSSGTQFDPELIRIFNKASNEFKKLN